MTLKSTFNAEMFLQTTTTAQLSTSLIPWPPGEYRAVISKIGARIVTQKDGQERPVLDITWETDDPYVVKATGLDKPTARQTIWLDTTESGAIDFGKGKNIGLGRLREALGQNRDGRDWSFNHLKSGVALIKTDVREDENSTSVPKDKYTDVQKVAALT